MAACASRQPTQEQLSAANWGSLPPNYQDMVRAHIGAALKDPYSAVFEFRQPVASWARLIGGDTEYAWVVCGTLNAKNSFGGYAGAQPFYAAIRDGRVISADFSNPERYGIHADWIVSRCNEYYGRALPVSPTTGVLGR